MEIKGTAVKSIPEFVRQKYASEYLNWIKTLSDNSQQIVNNVSSSAWYSLKDACIEPSQKVGQLLFNGDVKKGAWELGRFSAEMSLYGVYKLYVKFSSPGHIISRASRIFSAYYSPSKMATADLTSNSVKLVMTQFDTPSEVVEYRIAGWMERALEISGCKGIDVKVTKSLAKGDASTIFACSWN